MNPHLAAYHGNYLGFVVLGFLGADFQQVGVSVLAQRIRMAQVMGLKPGGDVGEAIAALNARLGLPPGLRAMGVAPDILPAMAEQAVKDHCNGTNPRRAGAAEYLELFQAAHDLIGHRLVLSHGVI